MCKASIGDAGQDGYRLSVEWSGNARIGGHRRSIGADVCSRKCLGAFFLYLSKEEEESAPNGSEAPK
jgi:hypothetical protein